MDPDETLRQILAIVLAEKELDDEGLRYLVLELDEWIRKGGFLPRRWGRSLKPDVRFNGGRGAILCRSCRTIIKEDLTPEEAQGKTPLLHCDKCFTTQNGEDE